MYVFEISSIQVKVRYWHNKKGASPMITKKIKIFIDMEWNYLAIGH